MRTRIFRCLVASVVLLAVPPLLLCCTHYCMGGHMAHGPYGWMDYASHWAYAWLIIAIFPLALLGDLPERKVLYLTAFVAWAALFIFPGLPVVLGLVATACFVLGKVGADPGSERSNQPDEERRPSVEQDDINT